MTPKRTIAVLPARLRALVEPHLPGWIDPRWWSSVDELHRHAPAAQIGWFDLHDKPPVLHAIELARDLRWLNSAFAGVDWLPLADLEERGVTVTCGSGLTASAVAEFAVMGMLAIAKDYRSIMRAADRGEWLRRPPDMTMMEGSRALIIGHGAIGRKIDQMLDVFGVEAVPVTRSGSDGSLRPDQWRARLDGFDWIVLAVPGTAETAGMIGPAELAAMKREAVLVNVARADVVDQPALISALSERRIAAALLDVTDPEPLPSDHPLWKLDNAHITMHLSGVPTPVSLERGARRFARNCEGFSRGEGLEGQVDLRRGY